LLEDYYILLLGCVYELSFFEKALRACPTLRGVVDSARDTEPILDLEPYCLGLWRWRSIGHRVKVRELDDVLLLRHDDQLLSPITPTTHDCIVVIALTPGAFPMPLEQPTHITLREHSCHHALTVVALPVLSLRVRHVPIVG
jgi:hypothetical protein